MYIVKNAIKNLNRNRGRNLLIGFVMFVIIAASGISIMIHTSANTIIEDYKTRFGSLVSFQVQDRTKNSRIDADVLMKLGNSELLQSKEYTAKVIYTSQGLTVIEETTEKSDPHNPNRLIPQGYLIGSNREDINDAFRKGTKKIISGTQYKGKNEVIISKALADKNKLKVGDTITLASTMKNQSMNITLTISGIYEDVSLGNKTTGLAMNHPDNEIYASFETVAHSKLYQEKGTLDASFFLKSPELLQKFIKECREKGLPDYIAVTTDEAGYQKIVKPVENMAEIANAFTIGVLIIGAFILLLLSTFSIRERKYEIGVLRAMGMKKNKVAMGLMSEILMITGICLVLGLSIAAISGKPIGDALLKQQAEISEQIGVQDKLTDKSIGLEHTAIAEIVILSLLLGVVSSTAGIIYITRYEPRKILSDHT